MLISLDNVHGENDLSGIEKRYQELKLLEINSRELAERKTKKWAD
jgi:hypothetical protein